MRLDFLQNGIYSLLAILVLGTESNVYYRKSVHGIHTMSTKYMYLTQADCPGVLGQLATYYVSVNMETRGSLFSHLTFFICSNQPDDEMWSERVTA